MSIQYKKSELIKPQGTRKSYLFIFIKIRQLRGPGAVVKAACLESSHPTLASKLQRNIIFLPRPQTARARISHRVSGGGGGGGGGGSVNVN